MRKVLMIARAFPPFLPVGHSIRVVKFIKYLPALGWLPVVLTLDDQKDYETTRRVGSESQLREIQPQVKIYRTTSGEPSVEFLEKEREFNKRNWLTKVMVKILGGARRWVFRNISLPDRYLAWLPFAVKQGRQIVKGEGIDVIFATCPPYSANLVGAVLKLFTGKPLVLDYRDDWIDTPWYFSKPPIRRIVERSLENWVVKLADKIILVTEWSRKSFQDRYSKQPANKFVLIPNGCDLGEFAILNSMSQVHRTSGFKIVHAGSLNVSRVWGRSLEGLFKAVRQLRQSEPELARELSMVFAGDLPEEHRRLAEEMGLADVINSLGHVPHEEVLQLLKSADLLLAINYEGWSTLIPGKIYEYWAVGRAPILLLSCPGAAASFVKQNKLGFTVDPSDIAGIHQSILTIYRQSKTATPLRVSTTGIEAYDRQALACRLAQALSTVI